jgi:hypothetical protein
MAFDPLGRPPRESQPARDIIVRPFRDFGGLSSIFATDTIQRAIDWSASANGTDGEAEVAVGQAGTFDVEGLTIKHGTRLIAPGRTATLINAVGGATPAQLFALDTGPVQKVEISGFTIDMSALPTQHALYFKAVPVLIDGVMQGGLWHALFKDLWIRGCAAESFWLRGGGDAGDAPHQFIRFQGLVVESAATGAAGHALRLTGQVGQLQGDATCRFDGISKATAGVNVLIERTVDDAGVNNGDAMPYTINLPVTCQSRRRLVTVERGLDISFDEAHFEEAEEGAHVDVSSGLTSLVGAYFGNVGHNGGGTGFLARVDSGRLVVGKNFIGGTVDTHFVRRFGGQLVLEGADADDNGIVTSGATLQVICTATLDTGHFKTVFVDGGSATNVTTIDSDLPVGAYLSLRANGGRVRFATGGNIDLGGAFDPFILPSGATITLVRNDLSGVWQLVGVSGPRGAYYGLPVFVNAAMSPYQILPDTDTVRVDASGGVVTLKLPSNADTPPGKDVTVKKLDSSSNVVRINGNVTAQNPDGQADNVVRLVDQTQAMTVRRNGTVGSGGWDTVSSVSARSGAPGVGALLTFGTHLVGSPASNYDGSQAITLTTDATSGSVVSTIVARDASGNIFGAGYFGGVAQGSPGSFAIQSGFASPDAVALTFGTDNTGYAFAIRKDFAGAQSTLFRFYDDGTLAVEGNGSGFLIGARTGFNRVLFNTGAGSFELRNSAGAFTLLNGRAFISNQASGVGFAIGDVGGQNRIQYNGSNTAFEFVQGSGAYASAYLGSVTFNNVGVGVVGGTMYYDISLGGITTISKAGATWDWSVWNPAGSTAPIIAVPTGTFNVQIQNDIVLNTASRGFVVSGTRRLSVSTSGVDVTGTFTASGTVNFSSGVFIVSSSGLTTTKPVTIQTTTSVTGMDISDSAGNTGLSFSPAASGDSVFIDNRRVGGVTQFRCSSATQNDKTWLSVSAAGVATLGFGVVFNSTISVASTASMAGATFSGGVTFNNTVTFSSTASFTTIASDLLPTPSGTKDLGGGSNKWRDYYSNGKLEIGTTIQTGAPSGGTAAPWRLGQFITAGVVFDSNHYVEIDIGGALRKLALVT